jgi:hypothetical protein
LGGVAERWVRRHAHGTESRQLGQEIVLREDGPLFLAGMEAGVSTVVTATAISGNNAATWNPTIHVNFGANMAAGVYLGTITHSVS